MTAIASPPPIQSSHSRNGLVNGSTGQVNLDSMSPEEISWMFIPRKSAQRSNSSTSLSSSSSSATVSSVTQPQTNGVSSAEQYWGTRKKPAKGIWPSSKAEPVSGISITRPQSVAANSGPSAASAIAALHAPQSFLPSQHMVQSQNQINGVPRAQGHPDTPVVLHLLPMNGTFERKTITVPYEPDLLRIGRQTNQKTLPTPLNGYFDSKVLSRSHAEIFANKEGKIFIKDVRSSNGTFVNGKRLSPEGKDSDAHLLKEQDVLELGIDIVSEDQKAVIHHKVAARVEHAGFYTQGNASLDPVFGELENQTVNGHGVQQLAPGFRNRNLSTNSAPSGSRFSHGASSSGGVSVHHAKWLQPITMEQVVKRLHTELRQARLQSQDLQYTSNFVDAVLSNEKPPPIPQQQKITSPIRNAEVKSRFSMEPPAPPPSQPLPEKPDVAPWSNIHELPGLQPLLRRSDTERPKLSSANSNSSSPTKTDAAHQIMSLMEALALAQQEISSQSERLHELDDSLQRERKARNLAEEQIEQLKLGTAAEKPDENDVKDEDPQNSTDVPPDFQARLDLMRAEMDQMRTQVESYRQRAESAETESQRDRKSLSEMVESIRRRDELAQKKKTRRKRARQGAEKSLTPQVGSYREAEASNSTEESDEDYDDPVDALISQEISRHPRSKENHLMNGNAVTSMSDAQLKQLSSVVSAAADSIRPTDGYRTAQMNRNNERLAQTAPYASILGVVLLGVGMMAYLNGWQRVAER